MNNQTLFARCLVFVSPLAFLFILLVGVHFSQELLSAKSTIANLLGLLLLFILLLGSVFTLVKILHIKKQFTQQQNENSSTDENNN